MVKGALKVCEPPQLFVMVTVPEFGTEIPGPAVTVRFPFNVYVLFEQVPGVAVKATPQVNEQSAEPEPLVWEKFIVPAELEKFVIRRI